jgi:hypothetical protein
VKVLVRAAVLTGLCFGASSASARADIIITPFVGKTFAAQTTFLTPATVDKQTWVVGASATWLTSSIIGAEVEFGYAPRFFGQDRFNPLTVPGSNVTTLMGNVLLTLPVSITRESLRPYVSGGMGILHAGVDDALEINTIDSNMPALSIGGGAIGFLNNRTGVRFDLRYIRSTSTDVDIGTLLTEPRLGFWRATIGVAIRY